MQPITVKETLFIAAPVEQVWDFTQDWTRRTLWDESIAEAVVLAEKPERVVRVKAGGGAQFTVRYKVLERPRRTTLALTDGTPAWLSGGGAWTYEARGGGTLWTQTNTLVISHALLRLVLGPLFSFQLRRLTRRAMRRAKALIETP